ncbi:hypothetical protein [Enterococcus termitis]|uniref:Uncharacterized protein n=1 Tax=Enterococcus termitis TaxID=332950 RepID=A0A1E5GJ88_9ENTE|nr:hypothetical protein [Enterococcus termitis]OEG12768.1 hypothetical protein BCR25_19455 [Enterococcus termitis]
MSPAKAAERMLDLACKNPNWKNDPTGEIATEIRILRRTARMGKNLPLENISLDNFTFKDYQILRLQGYTISRIERAFVNGNDNNKYLIKEFRYWRKNHKFVSTKL